MPFSGASSGFSLLFAPGSRPDAGAIMRLLQQDRQAAQAFAISHAPDPGEGWLELLCHGLTFELSGLAPAAGMAGAEVIHRFGSLSQNSVLQGEWLNLTVGRHLRGGQNLQPVVRGMAVIVLALLALDGVVAVAWGPARALLAQDYARRALGEWLAGGVFPALGLAALVQDASGALVSEGLGFFIGQELRLDPALAQDQAQAGRIATRLIHCLVDGWKVRAHTEIAGPGGESLGVEPVADGRVLRVWQITPKTHPAPH